MEARGRSVRGSVYVFAIENGRTAYAWTTPDGAITVSAEFPSRR
jgi:hypothetical protein